MAAQENNEIATKFSTLNVNAVEFVPSFNYSNVANAAVVAEAATPASANAPPSTQPQQPDQQQEAAPVLDNDVAPGAGAGSLPVSGSATPATTPDSTGSAGSTNALNATGGGGGSSGGGGTGTGAPSSEGPSNSASPAQGSPATTPSTMAAPIEENTNAADKLTANNETHTRT